MRLRTPLTRAGMLVALAACASPEHLVTPLAPGEISLGKAPANPSATFLFPTQDPTVGLLGDGAFTDGANSVYAPGQCGVATTIFVDGSGDATMNLQAAATGKSRCTRYLSIDYGDGSAPEKVAVFLNLNDLQNATTYRIPLGGVEERGLVIADTRCQGLRFKPALNGMDGYVTGAHNVLVKRTRADEWEVYSQPAPNNLAFCMRDSSRVAINVRFIVRSSTPLPL